MSKQTLVFDLTTGQWHQWSTLTTVTDPETEVEELVEGMWNMDYGAFWQELQGADGQPIYATVAGSLTTGELFRVDPESEVDNGGTGDERFIRRTVTGGLSVRGRNFVRQDDFSLTASVGDPAQAGAAVTMRFSDDNGNTWITPPDITLQAGAWNQDLTWRSLGVIRAPVRIFEVTDTGGVVRISGVAQARVDTDE